MGRARATQQDTRDTAAHISTERPRDPHILLSLAESSLTVAEGLREHYLRDTARFVAALHKAVRDPRRREPLIVVQRTDTTWAAVGPEVVTFVEVGVGSVTIAGRMPILLRVGSYRVRTGVRDRAAREQFGYWPMILGDLQGGTKSRDDFVDMVRILAELLRQE